MARSTVVRETLPEELSRYPHAVIAWVDDRGYPFSVATDFEAGTGSITMRPPAGPHQIPLGREVNVLFSHIRPREGVGYDERRYVSVWGTLHERGGSLELVPERTHGWDEEKMSFFELCERSVPNAHRYMDSLSREVGRPVKTKLSLGWVFFLATRVPFLTATIVPVLLGALVARHDGYSAWWLVVASLVGACAIHLGLNVTNDIADAASGADEANVNPTMFSGGSRVIQYGLVDVRSMRILAVAFYAVGIGIGLVLAATRGWELLLIGVAGVFLSIFYTASPLKLVHRGLGEICVALGFGPIMVLGSYFVVAQRMTFEAFYASLPVALLIMLVLYVNQVPDRPADEKAGKRTIVVRLSEGAIVTGYALSASAAFLLIVVGAATGILPAWTLLALGAAPLALQVYKGLRAHYRSPYELMGPMGKNVMLHFFAGLGMILGYLISTVV